MKKVFIATVMMFTRMILANESSFVQAYDAGKFDEAAKQIKGLDTTNAEVARRLGVMYYDAKGVDGDQVKGLTLLEQAMLAGDAVAAVNLTKIYFRIEKNFSKSAWCLMVAECLNDVTVKDDVSKLRGYLGDNYLKGAVSYITQLRDELANEQAAFKKKMEESERERASLLKRIISSQNEAKKTEETFAREREELTIANEDLGKKLVSAEETIVSGKEEVGELTMENDKLKLSLANLQRELKEQADKVTSLEKQLNTIENNLGTTKNDIAEYKRILKTMEARPLGKVGDTEKIESSQIFMRYNQLVEKYNLLVRRYNGLLDVSYDLGRKAK